MKWSGSPGDGGDQASTFQEEVILALGIDEWVGFGQAEWLFSQRENPKEKDSRKKRSGWVWGSDKSSRLAEHRSSITDKWEIRLEQGIENRRHFQSTSGHLDFIRKIKGVVGFGAGK